MICCHPAVSRRIRPVFLAFLVVLVAGTLNAGAAAPVDLRAQVDAAIAKVRPALVRIRVVAAEYGDGREIKMQEVGSGAIITRDGYLITNHHVAGHGKRMFCTLSNREEIEADLVGTDPLTDIAVLKLKPARPQTFTPAAFGDSSLLRVGDSVLAMGSPMALSQSVTLGIISNTEMVLPRFWGSTALLRLEGENVGALVRWIAHDAAIYGGNSGGPLVNLRGEIIGINEISFGLGGAIPGNLARSVADQLRARGRIDRSWLGIDVQPLFKHAAEDHGVMISGVLENSPASRAGLEPGDILLRLGETATDVRFDEQMPGFMQLASSLPIGREINARIRRGDRELNVALTPVERGEAQPQQQELKAWGLTARNLSALMAREMKRDSLDGVVVTSVRPGGPAGEAKPPLQSADVIVEVGGVPVKNLAGLGEATGRLMGGKNERVPVIVTFERKADRYLTVIRVGLQELKDPGLEVSKAWLPVETQVISRDIASQLGQPDLKGFYITRVYPGTTADKAGLKTGDFIVAIDQEPLTATGAEHQEELPALVRQHDIGKTVELAVLSGGRKRTVPVELARSPRLQREMKKYRNDDFEFTARDISFFDAANEQWESTQRGAFVEEVKSGSWAELGSLRARDLIVEVDSQTIGDVDDLRRELERVAAARKQAVVMKVLRGIHSLFLEMEPNWQN